MTEEEEGIVSGREARAGKELEAVIDNVGEG